MSVINIHSGHAKSGNKYCGASSLLNESVENRKIKDIVISNLRGKGHTVYDCTVDSGKSQTNILSQICAKCNAHTVDLDVSIHLNGGRSDLKGDGSIGGVECLVTSKSGVKYKASESICKQMNLLGFKNRGTKISNSLYFLNKTKAQAVLIEVCFVDDKDDFNLYTKLGVDKISGAITIGILEALNQNTTVPNTKPITIPKIPDKTETVNTKEFRIKVKCNSLNIRKTPNGVVVGVIKDKGTYTIVEEKNGWGRLKSNIGWISLGTSLVEKI